MNIPYTLSGLLQAGLTQTQIGDAIGKKQPTISDMLKGKAGVTRPSNEVVDGLRDLAAKHGVATDPPDVALQPEKKGRRHTDHAPPRS